MAKDGGQPAPRPPPCPVTAPGFHLSPGDPLPKARAFVLEMALDCGIDPAPRLAALKRSWISTGRITHSHDELTWGARVAWRNAARCIGRMIWPSLEVCDARDARSEAEVFDHLLAHVTDSTNGGTIRPMVTIFSPAPPHIRILNAQLILYAGYRQADGTILGDPRNVALTDLALNLGWRGRGTRFDILPLLVRIGARPIQVFEWPAEAVLEVEITHPEHPAVGDLGLRWFALPAVSAMALDMGGVVYRAAPSSGVYMGTEIGSLNLGDPRRYDQLGPVADALGLARDRNPLWRDQALVELNRAVLHSFAQAGVRIHDHHSLSESFGRFRAREAREH